MSTKLTRKEKIALQKDSGIVSPKQAQKKQGEQKSIRNLLGFILAALAFLLYVNTFNHDYVLDDFGVIKDNTQTKQGISAIPEIFKSSYRYGMNITDYTLYRPLTKAMFAVEWQLAPNKPFLSHFLNVLFFAISCLVLFKVLTKYLNGQLILPFIAVLLFVAHPIHAEVVANIKSRDEIIAFLLCLLSAGAYYDWIKENKTSKFVFATLCFFVSLFSKESTITFIAAMPLLFYFFTEAKSSHYYRTIGAMSVCTVIFLLIRRKILGDVISVTPMIDNYIAGLPDFLSKKVNAIYMLGYYVKTIIFPYPLISDGSYNHFKAVTITDWKFLLSLVVLLGAFIYGVMTFKKKSIASFSILFFFITVSVASNLFMIIGTNYGERLMYVPSLGYCLLIAFLLTKLFKSDLAAQTFTSISTFFNNYKMPIIISSIIFLVYSAQAYNRSMEWKDNYTLYTTDLKKIPDSAHMLFYLANHITTDEYFALLPDSTAIKGAQQEGIDYLTRAITVYPEYADGYQRRAYIYKQTHRDSLAEADYILSLKFNPTNPVTCNNYATLLFDQARFEDAKHFFEQAVRYNPNYAHALNNLASSYGVYGQGELDAMKTDPANAELHRKNSQANFEMAISYFLKSIEADPEFGEPYRLAAVTYGTLGDQASSEKYNNLYQKVMRAKKSDAKN